MKIDINKLNKEELLNELAILIVTARYTKCCIEGIVKRFIELNIDITKDEEELDRLIKLHFDNRTILKPRGD